MGIFNLCKYPGGFWFRLFGYGIAGKDLRVNALPFTQRYGYTRTYRLGNWSFYFLDK